MNDQNISPTRLSIEERLRRSARHRADYERRPIIVPKRRPGPISDITFAQPKAKKPTTPPAPKPQVPTRPAALPTPTALPAPTPKNTQRTPQHTQNRDSQQPSLSAQAFHRSVRRPSAAKTPRLIEVPAVARRWPRLSFGPISTQSVLLTTMAMALFVGGAWIAVVQMQTNRHVAAQVQPTTETAQGDNSNSDTPPSETKPDLHSYVVSPLQPRILSIPKLSVNARVMSLGVKPNNELQAPNNIYDVGWYQNSAKPGDSGGAILLDGHVHGPTIPGVFANLKTLAAGNVIKLERGDGTIHTFKVIKSEAYPADKLDMAAALTSVEPGKLGLNLITCTGSFNAASSQYEQRLIVFAVAT